MQALLEKGASLGTVLAFMMSVIALSLPETIILKKVLETSPRKTNLIEDMYDISQAKKLLEKLEK